MWSELAKMRRMVQKAQEEKAKRERDELEGSERSRERIVTSETRYERGEITEFGGNGRLTPSVGVFSPFFNQDRTSQTSSDTRSQDVLPLTQISQSYYDKKPNLGRLRANAANTAMVPSRTQDSSVIRSISNLASLGANVANTVVATLGSQDSSLISKQDMGITSVAARCLSGLEPFSDRIHTQPGAAPPERSPLSIFGLELSSEVMFGHAAPSQRAHQSFLGLCEPVDRQPPASQLKPISRQVQNNTPSTSFSDNDLDPFNPTLHMRRYEEDFDPFRPTLRKGRYGGNENLYGALDDQLELPIQIPKSSRNVGSSRSVSTTRAPIPHSSHNVGAQALLPTARAGPFEERRRNETYLRHIRATVETSTDGMACSSSDAYPPPRRTLPTALPIAHSNRTNANRPSDQPFSTLGSVCFFGERDEPMRRELTAIEKEKPTPSSKRPIEKVSPPPSSKRPTSWVQPPRVAINQQTEQSVVRRDEVPTLTVAQREPQVESVTKRKGFFPTTFLLDLFRRKKNEEDPDDRRRRIQRENKQAWRENNERRLAEAAAASLRRKNETPAQRQLRQQMDAASHVFVRSQETAEQTEQRLAIQTVATRDHRDAETEAERAQRRQADAASHAFDRSEETDGERAARLAIQAVATRDRRDAETEAERAARLAIQAVATRDRRDAETEAEREERVANQAVTTRELRAAETDAERLQRVENNANARRDRRAAEINDRVREIQRVQGVLRDNDDETAITRHNCGDMNVICPFCGSHNFPGENDQFTKCCCKGKLIIRAAANEEYPQLLREMMSDPSHPEYTNFRDHIRNYNSSVSFASMGAKTVQAPGHGPYCFKVHGSVYHKTSHVQAVGGNAPQYAQLYILDRATQVVQTAIQHPSNVNNIIGTVLYKIVDFMRKNNRLAATYRMMADVLKAEEEKARRTNTIVPTINMVMRRNRTSDARRYNLPLENEVAMVFVGENVGEPPFQRDIQIYPKNPTDPNHHFIKINILSANLDPMTYAILFPFGQPGWHGGMVIDGFKPSMLQYKQAQLAIRDRFNPIISAGRLTQQWIVDSYLQVEANNLNYIRHQKKLRAEEYAGLRDFVNRRATEAGLRAGQPIILPSSFEGSPRNMRERLQDAMSIFAKFGAVDAFITFTANPAWPEIVNNLRPGETSSDRPDLVARVFNLKLKALIEDITVNHALGRTVAYVYTIEFQKRGLPHAHILVVFAEADKFRTTDRIDEVVSAEIPDKNVNPELYRIVIKNMLHGPCGSKHPDAPCMEDGKCSKEFPKEFKVLTDVNKSGSGYGMYRRRDTKRGIIKSGTWLDNRYVVPYNKYLLLKYNAHINVEVCTSMKAVKYIYKYIYKGFDCANFAIGAGDVNDRDVIFDEINNFIDARYISAPEGMWRLLEHHMHGRSIPVIHLDVHLPNQQRLYYEEGQEDEALVRAEGRETKLTAWFKLNEADVNARQYRYTEIPEYYTFTKDGIWRPRQRGRVLPRIYSVSPSDQESFYLRILLLHVRGATSYEFLRTVNGTLYATFREGALHRQLISDDTEWHNLMQEAKNAQMPAQLRQTLAFIFIFCLPSNPEVLFNDFKDDLILDFRYRDHRSEQESINLALHHIESILQQHRQTCTNFGLPAPIGTIQEALSYQVLEERRNAAALIPTLNTEQRAAFNKIVEGIEQPLNGRKQKLFFLNGPGGSGKTYLYNALISYVRGQGKTVASFATTGIASTLIKGGNTVHSGFGLPVPTLETSTSKIKLHFSQGQELRNASLIIIDECTMLTQNGLRIIETLLKCEIMQNSEDFGGKVLVLGGDFRQTLPVVPGGRRATIIESCLFKSNFWCQFEQLSLISNMRSAGQNAYNKWLLDIGKGETGAIAGLSMFAVNIPNNLITNEDIVVQTFGNNIPGLSTDELSKRAILCSTNKEALEVNNTVISKLPGEIKHYYSSDSIVVQDADDKMDYPDEFLHAQQPSGMPPHVLSLKKGAIVMLLRNLNRRKGLCNGTRMVITDMKDSYLQCEIISDFCKGDAVILSRLDLTPSDTTLPFKLRRRQFPIIPAFAMTINKSQGQSFEVVGVHLNDPVFAHGQLYVALSRSRDPTKIKVFIKEGPKQGRLLPDGRYYTENIVYKEVFETVQ